MLLIYAIEIILNPIHKHVDRSTNYDISRYEELLQHRISRLNLNQKLLKNMNHF